MRPWLKELINAPISEPNKIRDAVISFGSAAQTIAKKSKKDFAGAQLEEFNDAISLGSLELKAFITDTYEFFWDELINKVAYAKLFLQQGETVDTLQLFDDIVNRLSFEKEKSILLKMKENEIQLSQKSTAKNAFQLAEESLYKNILIQLKKNLEKEKNKIEAKSNSLAHQRETELNTAKASLTSLIRITSLKRWTYLNSSEINKIAQNTENIYNCHFDVKKILGDNSILDKEPRLASIFNETAILETKNFIDYKTAPFLTSQTKKESISSNDHTKPIIFDSPKKKSNNPPHKNEEKRKESPTPTSTNKKEELILQSLLGTTEQVNTINYLLNEIDRIIEKPTAQEMEFLQNALADFIEALDLLTKADESDSQSYLQLGTRYLSDTYNYYTNKPMSTYSTIGSIRTDLSLELTLFSLVKPQQPSSLVNQEEKLDIRATK